MNQKIKNIIITIIVLIIGIGVFNFQMQLPQEDTDTKTTSQSSNSTGSTENTIKQQESNSQGYLVRNVIDGDTIEVLYDGKTTKIRLIGIDTPESTTLRNGHIECFGKEASDYLKELIIGKKVNIELDTTQGRYDQYGRILAYIFFDGVNINNKMIADGYAYEYTYKHSYKYIALFKKSEKTAKNNLLGLWGNDTCGGQRDLIYKDEETKEPQTGECLIKGNISYKTKEKIYHMPGCSDYENTKINTDKGDKWFCSEKQAHDAGWRKANNCD